MTDPTSPSSKTFPAKIDTTKLIRTFKLHAGKMKSLLDNLDSEENGLPSGTYSYRKTAVLFIPDADDNEQNAYLVATRYVSQHKVSFLFGGFFHANKPIMVRLTTLFNAWEDVTGTVDSCRHIDGSIHEIVLRFDKPIDASLLTPEADSIRVLVVEDDPLFVQVARNHLKALNAEVEHAPNGQVGVEMAMEKIYDAVLMDMEMPVMDGLTAIQTLRERGYAGTIIAVTGMTRPQVQERCTKAGCDGFVGKPYTKESLSKIIRDLRGEPIYSEFENDPNMREIIQMFIKDLPIRLRGLLAAINKRDAKECEVQIRALKASSGACGFSGLCDLADTIESALIEGADLADVQNDIKKFVRQCRRIRTRQTSAAARQPAEESQNAVDSTADHDDTVTESSADEPQGNGKEVAGDEKEEPNLKIRCA